MKKLLLLLTFIIFSLLSQSQELKGFKLASVYEGETTLLIEKYTIRQAKINTTLGGLNGEISLITNSDNVIIMINFLSNEKEEPYALEHIKKGLEKSVGVVLLKNSENSYFGGEDDFTVLLKLNEEEKLFVSIGNEQLMETTLKESMKLKFDDDDF